MDIAIIVAVGACLIGLLRGGSLESLASTRLRLAWLLFAGLVLQVGFDLLSPDWGGTALVLVVLVVSNALVVGFLFANRRLPGIWLVAIGLVLNLAVISTNGAMPVSRDVAEAAGGSLEDPGYKHEALTEDTTLPWLGDLIPVRPLHSVLSVGDVLLATGIAILVYSLTTSNRSARHRARPAA